MRVFSNPNDKEYKSLITEYELYLPEYFGKLVEAKSVFPMASENTEYLIYVKYNKWPIRKLEYSYVISEMEKAIFLNAKVLDAGCGVSPMPFLWSKLGGDVTAVDFDEKNIELMRQLNDNDYFGANKKITLDVYDIMCLPYENHAFDIVTSISVIEHLPYPNYLLALNELYRVLKPGGILICTCDIKADKESKRNAVGAFSTEDIIKILGNFEDELLNDSRDYKSLGIANEEIEHFWKSHYYEGIGYEGNRQYVATGFSIKKKLDEDKKEKLLPYNHVINELIEYQKKVQDLLDKLELKNRFILEIENEGNQRLNDINKLTEMYKEVDKESQNRLNDIYTLTNIIRQKEEETKQKDEQLKYENEVIAIERKNLEESKQKCEIELENLLAEKQKLANEIVKIKGKNQILATEIKDLRTGLNNLLENKFVKYLRKIKLLKWEL